MELNPPPAKTGVKYNQMKKVIPEKSALIPENASKVFAGKIFEVHQWPQVMFDGTTATFEMLKRPDTVTVIPIYCDQIIVIEDEQPHSGSKISFPGGRVDKTDESILAAAKREAKEEIGYEFNQWKLVNVTQPHAKLEWFIYFYIAWDGQKTTDPHLDAGERITVKKLTFAEAKKFVVTKSGYLGESMDVFDKATSLEDLKCLPEFSGEEVNIEPA